MVQVFYALSQNSFFEIKFNLAESLTFGALISAVDPVATLSIFGSLGVDTRLNMLVFGESGPTACSVQCNVHPRAVPI